MKGSDLQRIFQGEGVDFRIEEIRPLKGIQVKTIFIPLLAIADLDISKFFKLFQWSLLLILIMHIFPQELEAKVDELSSELVDAQAEIAELKADT